MERSDVSSVTRIVPDVAKLEIRERGEKAEMSRLDQSKTTGPEQERQRSCERTSPSDMTLKCPEMRRTANIMLDASQKRRI